MSFFVGGVFAMRENEPRCVYLVILGVRV
jgi:hypothetical protein